MNTPEDEPSTSELMQFYSEQHKLSKDLKAQLAQVEAIIEGLEEILLERVPAGVDSMLHKCHDGTKVTIRRKVTTRYQPAAGKSPEFWAWCAAEARWDLVGRTVLQTGVVAYLNATGSLPPGVEKFEKETAGVTVTVGVPS